VVDTSYWLELFKIPNHFKDEHYSKIKQLFTVASHNQYSLYLPIPVLFELANHIAHVSDGSVRRELSQKFSETVKRGISNTEMLFNIMPCMAFSVASELNESLDFFVSRFVSEFSTQGLGFTDSSIILEAKSLKKDINKVHIWTLDRALKAREPDAESNPFTGDSR